MATSAVTAFTQGGGSYVASAVLVTLVCTLVNFPSISLWTGFGVTIGRLLRTPRHWRFFNITMGVLTAGCVLMII